jgi:hypothetical protein
MSENNTKKYYKSSNKKWCLFEDHVFNIRTKVWELADVNKGFRVCLYSKCDRIHKVENRPVTVCKDDINCSEAGISCFLLHDNTKMKSLCYWGYKCINNACHEYRHPSNRSTQLCDLNELCKDAMITCFKLHDMDKIVPLCHYNNDCVNYICNKRHSKERNKICENGSMCWDFITGDCNECTKIHPKILQKICKWDNTKEGCRTYGCTFLHSPDSFTDCINSSKCNDTDCKNKHPKILF